MKGKSSQSAVFENARIVQYNSNHSNNLIINIEREEPAVHQPTNITFPKKYSLSPSKQGSFTEPIFEHVEKSLFRFISKHHQFIPSKTVKSFTKRCIPPRKSDFSDADLLCLLNFMIQNINLFKDQHNQSLFNGEYKLNPKALLKSFKEERNYNAHGITQSEGRWDDRKLRRLTTLALEVVVCVSKFYNSYMD
jgi:hypothetical protein